MEFDEEEIEKIKKRINDLKQNKDKIIEIQCEISKLPYIDKRNDEIIEKVDNLLDEEYERIGDLIIDEKLKAGTPAIAIFFEGE